MVQDGIGRRLSGMEGQICRMIPVLRSSYNYIVADADSDADNGRVKQYKAEQSSKCSHIYALNKSQCYIQILKSHETSQTKLK